MAIQTFRERVRVVRDIIRSRVRFAKLHGTASYPRIDALCEFRYPGRIAVGRNVKFLRGAIVSADPIGWIEINDDSAIARYAVVQTVGGTITIGRNSRYVTA